jgi:hypothetical protein
MQAELGESPFMSDESETATPSNREQTRKSPTGQNGGDEMISAAGIYQSIRELRDAVTSLKKGQDVLLKRTLPVSEMPAPDDGIASQTVSEEIETKVPREVPRGFFTTPFSSLQIPLIPVSLADLKVERRVTEDEIAVSPIPAEDRSDRAQLLAEPLQSEPNPWIENSPAAATVLPETDEADTHHHLSSEAPAAIETEEEAISSPQEFPETSSTAEIKTAEFERSQPFLSAEEVLAEKIAEAKSNQSEELTKRPKSAVWGADEKPGKGVFITVVLVLLVLLVAGLYAWRETDIFAAVQTDPAETTATTPENVEPPLLKLPRYGVAIPDDDSRVEDARQVARKFADAQSIDAVIPLVQPVERDLLENFYEPMVDPTLELYQARQLNKNRLEFDFLVKDYGRPERLLPVVKIGEGPYLIDWKIFAECEELTLLSLTQGTLILDDGEEVDSGAIRAWMEKGKKESMDFPVGNYQGFLLHDITEQAIAAAYAKKESPALQQLSKALANTQILYKGRPAIRTVLRVERIVEADPESDIPAKLEIKEVIATDWRADTTSAPQTSPTAPTEKPVSPPTEPVEESQENRESPNFPESPLPPVDGLKE